MRSGYNRQSSTTCHTLKKQGGRVFKAASELYNMTAKRFGCIEKKWKDREDRATKVSEGKDEKEMGARRKR